MTHSKQSKSAKQFQRILRSEITSPPLLSPILQLCQERGLWSLLYVHTSVSSSLLCKIAENQSYPNTEHLCLLEENSLLFMCSVTRISFYRVYTEKEKLLPILYSKTTVFPLTQHHEIRKLLRGVVKPDKFNKKRDNIAFVLMGPSFATHFSF